MPVNVPAATPRTLEVVVEPVVVMAANVVEFTIVMAEPARVAVMVLPAANPVPEMVMFIPLTIPVVGVTVSFGVTVKVALAEVYEVGANVMV
jgi:hypothetical protein